MSPGAPNLNLVQLQRVTSTMDVLDELIAAGAPEWTVVLADEQTRGLGRAGRTWEARCGSSLLCSILVRPRFAPHQTGMLAIAVGVALAEYLETLGVTVTLKWPNDVLLDGRKLAGILIRARRDAVGDLANVGIGLNLTGSGERGLNRARLDEVIERAPDPADVATELATHLARRLSCGSTSELRDAWMTRAALVGEPVQIEEGGQLVGGVLLGIDAQGALVIETDGGGRRTVAAGDLVRGPRAGGG